MAQTTPNVKPDKDSDTKRALLRWIDAHPRTGWYIAGLVTLNFVLNLLDALDVDPFWFTR